MPNTAKKVFHIIATTKTGNVLRFVVEAETMLFALYYITTGIPGLAVNTCTDIKVIESSDQPQPRVKQRFKRDRTYEYERAKAAKEESKA